MSKSSYQAFREKLDLEHKWPGLYLFKFIVPKEKEEEIYNILPEKHWSKRHSKSGTYISFTAKVTMQSSDDVIEIYKQAHTIKGLIAL